MPRDGSQPIYSLLSPVWRSTESLHSALAAPPTDSSSNRTIGGPWRVDSGIPTGGTLLHGSMSHNNRRNFMGGAHVNAPPPPSMASFSAFSRNSRSPGAKRARGGHPQDIMTKYLDVEVFSNTSVGVCVCRLLKIRCLLRHRDVRIFLLGTSMSRQNQPPPRRALGRERGRATLVSQSDRARHPCKLQPDAEKRCAGCRPSFSVHQPSGLVAVQCISFNRENSRYIKGKALALSRAWWLGAGSLL